MKKQALHGVCQNSKAVKTQKALQVQASQNPEYLIEMASDDITVPRRHVYSVVFEDLDTENGTSAC